MNPNQSIYTRLFTQSIYTQGEIYTQSPSATLYRRKKCYEDFIFLGIA